LQRCLPQKLACSVKQPVAQHGVRDTSVKPAQDAGSTIEGYGAE
jgi:hypothetical protein